MRLSHVTWNLAGLSLPLIVAAVAVPYLIHRLGNERFGLLALVWGLMGYANALDLGIGRALTQIAARLQGEGRQIEIPDVLITAGRITLAAGLGGAALICVAAAAGIANLVVVTDVPKSEITKAIFLLAVALPAQAMSATYKGLNEAFLNFKGINLLRIAVGMLSFGGPAAMAQFTTELPWLTGTLVASRLASFLCYRWLAYSCLRRSGIAHSTAAYSPTAAKSMFLFGSWLTISSILSPVMMQADRFFIASLLSAAAVTTYVLPYEVVVQSLLLVGSVTSVIFPTLSKLVHEGRTQWERYFKKWLWGVSGFMVVACIFLALSFPFLLQLWLKSDLQSASISVGQILCLGVVANSVGSMHYALLHALGRADITAKIHMIEIPIYMTSLLLLVNHYGVAGAAWAWTGRMAFDALLLNAAARAVLHQARQ